MAIIVNEKQLPIGGIARELVGDRYGGLGISMLFIEAAPGEGPAVHQHDYAEIIVVLEGSVLLANNEGQHHANAGDIIIVGPNEPHGFINDGSGSLRQIDITATPPSARPGVPVQIQSRRGSRRSSASSRSSTTGAGVPRWQAVCRRLDGARESSLVTDHRKRSTGGQRHTRRHRGFQVNRRRKEATTRSSWSG
jgi:quercetin dioxygenase-like cupin family protein